MRIATNASLFGLGRVMRPFCIRSFCFWKEPDDVHNVFSVIAMFFLKFRAVNVFLSCLTERSFHLIVREPGERFHVPPRKK